MTAATAVCRRCEARVMLIDSTPHHEGGVICRRCLIEMPNDEFKELVGGSVAQITDEMVERAARAWEPETFEPPVDEATRADALRDARRALAAALGEDGK